MLREILESAGLKPKVCADLLGLDHKLFHEWLTGQRPLPGYIVPELSSVLGVPREAILSSRRNAPGLDNAPAIWFKFRSGDKLTQADREIVIVIRRLAHFMEELERLTETRLVTWKGLFEIVRKEVDRQASPREQGILAARLVRADRQLGFPFETKHGIRGAGDVMRSNLRSIGIRIIETPVPSSNLEGCAFYVGAPGSERPGLFANTYQLTWFRRNIVIMHELGHAIFDIDTSAASLDFVGDGDERQLEEVRAQAFAQETLVPREVLNHIARTRGLRWDHLSPRDLALLVASTQVEQRTVIKAAVEAEFIPGDLAQRYREMNIHSELMELTEHAFTTEEFLESRRMSKESVIPAEARTTTIPTRALRLPLPYVSTVLELANSNEISHGKAAQMLMIDKDTLRNRFGSLLQGGIA